MRLSLYPSSSAHAFNARFIRVTLHQSKNRLMHFVEPQVTIRCTSCVMFNKVGISTAEITNSESSCVERAYIYYTDDGSLILGLMIWAQRLTI